MKRMKIAMGLGLGLMLAVAGLTAGMSVGVKVMCSGAFTAAYNLLAPQFEKQSGARLDAVFGPSMGSAPTAIPVRLAGGESGDVVIMARPALDDLVRKNLVVADTEVDLAQSRIGMAVRAGAPVPDISTVEAFSAVLLKAKSIAYSDSASGVYIQNVMYKKMGIERQMVPKSRMIPATPVGEIVARGEAEIGFQQLSELKPVQGITIVGPIPEAVQSVTVFSAGVLTKSSSPQIARALIQFLASPEACPAVRSTALDPVACPDKGKP